MATSVNRRNTRLRSQGSSDFWQRSFQARGIESLSEMKHFFEAANIRIDSVADTGVNRWKVAQLGDLTLVQAVVPKSEAVWTRDHHSIDRVLVVVGDYASIRIEGTGVVAKEPGVFVVPPGEDHTTMHFLAPVNEFILGSIPASLVSSVISSDPPRSRPGAIEASLVRPLRDFLIAHVQLPVREGAGPGLRHVVGDVFRALVRLAYQDSDATLDLTERARQEMMLDISNPELNAELLAPKLGVSPRQLQLEFQRSGTTVQRELRRLRAAGAMQVKRENPSIDIETLAKVYGFGSTSTLYRAMAEEAERAEVTADAG